MFIAALVVLSVITGIAGLAMFGLWGLTAWIERSVVRESIASSRAESAKLAAARATHVEPCRQ